MVGPIHTVKEHDTLTSVGTHDPYSIDRINYVNNRLNTSNGY